MEISPCLNFQRCILREVLMHPRNAPWCAWKLWLVKIRGIWILVLSDKVFTKNALVLYVVSFPAPILMYINVVWRTDRLDGIPSWKVLVKYKLLLQITHIAHQSDDFASCIKCKRQLDRLGRRATKSTMDMLIKHLTLIIIQPWWWRSPKTKCLPLKGNYETELFGIYPYSVAGEVTKKQHHLKNPKPFPFVKSTSNQNFPGQLCSSLPRFNWALN